MARSCSICTRPDAGAINELIRAGRSALSVASEFGAGHRALLRHAANHGIAAVPNRPATPRASGDPLDELVGALRARALAGDAAAAREYRLALAAQAATHHAIGAQRELAAEPEWIDLRGRILFALEPFAEARLAVAAALERTH
jgi:hypothetical protein